MSEDNVKMDCSITVANESIEPPQFSTKLLDLNDTCLSRIARFLPLDELNSIACSCAQLNAIACVAFNKRPSNKEFDFNQMHYQLAGFDYNEIVEIKARRLLKNFGHLLHEINLDVNMISIDKHHNMIPIIEDIVKYCSGGELTKLRISHVKIDIGNDCARHELIQQFEIILCHVLQSRE